MEACFRHRIKKLKKRGNCDFLFQLHDIKSQLRVRIELQVIKSELCDKKKNHNSEGKRFL